ncbi:MAG: hypothetical protein N3F05_00065 [Candidatus Diapherotrites archaeon]|nr:hypothetical protein [Candidatus Diapherotrites archaeon]
MNKKAQVSFDYLTLLAFVIALVVAGTVLVVYIEIIADNLRTEVLKMQSSLLQSLMR